jgi:IS1 family transposase
MNVLSFERQTAIIAALVDGCSIRATERLTETHRDTIMRLGVRVGQGCAELHDAMMRNLQVARLELDEAWSYVGKKQARVTQEDGDEIGDQYVFIGMASSAKAIISYTVGRRNAANTRAFAQDLRDRVLGRPEISSDGFNCYPEAIDRAFGIDCTYGMVDKHYSTPQSPEASRRYSPRKLVSIFKRNVDGYPTRISTSLVERQNLTLRMGQRRFTRLTNAFSKKLENHCAAVSLYVAHYNFCRVHEALRITPAMQLGITDHIWSIGELVDAALNGVLRSEQVAA